MIRRLFYWLFVTCILVIGLRDVMPGEMTPAKMTTLCVRPDGANGCYETIQEGVNAAASQDTILIAGGTYTETVTISQTLNLIGGWQPPGWPLTHTLIIGQSGNCTICVSPSLAGSLSHITLSGGTQVGFSGAELVGYALAEVMIEHYATGVELTAPCPTTAMTNPNFSAILSHTQFQQNDLAVQVSCGYHLSVEASRFMDNNNAITSRGALIILQNNLFALNDDVLTALGSEWIISYSTIADNSGDVFTVYEDINCLDQTSITVASTISWANGNLFSLIPQPTCANNPTAIPFYQVFWGGNITQGYANYQHDPQFTFLLRFMM